MRLSRGHSVKAPPVSALLLLAAASACAGEPGVQRRAAPECKRQDQLLSASPQLPPLLPLTDYLLLRALIQLRPACPQHRHCLPLALQFHASCCSGIRLHQDCIGRVPRHRLPPPLAPPCAPPQPPLAVVVGQLLLCNHGAAVWRSCCVLHIWHGRLITCLPVLRARCLGAAGTRGACLLLLPRRRHWAAPARPRRARQAS